MVKTLDSLSYQGKRVFLRCDLNVPLQDDGTGKRIITDDGRIRASLPTINYLLSAGASLVICAHLGRPKGERKPELSLAPIAERLRELLGQEVVFATDVIGDSAKAAVASIKPGGVVLLENIRYESGETSKSDEERLDLAKKLASYADLYVGDGFGAVHRKHASVYELAQLLPHAAGKLVSAEVDVLRQLTENPKRPYGVVLGGAKVSDKIGVITNLIEKVDVLAVGGGMVFTFLAAQGHQIGTSLFEAESIDTVKAIINRAKERGVELYLPTDVVVAPKFADENPTTVPSNSIPSDQMGLDIGPESAATFAAAIANCKTVFWNGPMGVFEFRNFSAGTRVVAESLTKVEGLSVVGGGDSAAAVRALGFADKDFGYISTGGGASLEYLEGKELPGLQALA
ncbi:MAG: phosphoglycerate kinase [Candidatus Nanopelagicaceae bacterium]|nr:phosphoglycerate kinase [Actinomycetota bacterium]NCV43665.1 phosphoglycerate kinase [Actinomycetota bacterium]NCW75309.1 phosphoglycerate kinase [Actinomycetota bacterium]NCW93484.1 phosphoglycerate kinase [Actinomycetota bacterium]NCW96605.1 phosphoglycerate kinase [Actinomycetota bacterium]